MKVRDLPDDPKLARLACDVCHNDYSATAGDYFFARPEQTLTCCHEPLKLVIVRTIWKEVR
jgi:hypothetical protein